MENKKYPTSVIIKFLACSLIGIFLFFVPITLNGKSTIPLDHIVNFVLKIPYFKEMYGTLVIIIGVFLPFYKKTWNKNTTSIVFSLLKILALPFLFMVLLNKGPEFLTISSKKSPTSISGGWIAFLFSWNCFKNMI